MEEENKKIKKADKKAEKGNKKIEKNANKKTTIKINENAIKTVKILTIVLLVVLISMIGFAGIYEKDKGQYKNVLKEYKTSIALNGARTVKLAIKDESSSDDSTDSENSENTDNTANDENNTSKGEENSTDESSSDNNTNESTDNSNKSEDEKNEKVKNYKKSKEVIEKRLKDLGVTEYKVRLNEETGEIEVDIPENSETDNVVSVLTEIGKFEIVDADTNEVLMNNDDIKSAKVMYSSSTSGTSVYLELIFDKDGKDKLNNISKTYVKAENTTNDTSDSGNTTDENSANSTDENAEAENSTNSTDENTTNDTSADTSKDKQITMKIDDETIMTTYFDEEIKNGKLDLTIGSATTDSDKLQENIKQGQNFAATLQNGKLEGNYEASTNEYIPSKITQKELTITLSIIAAITCVGIIALIIKFKLNGLLSGISFIGFVALCTLILRYTNVMISLESMTSIVVASILNYMFIWIFLKNIDSNIKENIENPVAKARTETYKKFFLDILPICFVSIVCCFVKWTPINTFGMTSFWSISTIAIYNVIITNSLLSIKES